MRQIGRSQPTCSKSIFHACTAMTLNYIHPISSSNNCRLGAAQFSILQSKGLDSVCWREAAASIEADCQTMPHARKQRLAVQLSNCHLQVNDLGLASGQLGHDESPFLYVLAMLHATSRAKMTRNIAPRRKLTSLPCHL